MALSWCHHFKLCDLHPKVPAVQVDPVPLLCEGDIFNRGTSHIDEGLWTVHEVIIDFLGADPWDGEINSPAKPMLAQRGSCGRCRQSKASLAQFSPSVVGIDIGLGVEALIYHPVDLIDPGIQKDPAPVSEGLVYIWWDVVAEVYNHRIK